MLLLFRVGVGGLLTAFTLAGCLGATLVFPELVGLRCYPLNPITGCALTGRGALALPQRWVLASIPNFPKFKPSRDREASIAASLSYPVDRVPSP
jgi:hypothetical protein